MTSAIRSLSPPKWHGLWKARTLVADEPKYAWAFLRSSWLPQKTMKRAQGVTVIDPFEWPFLLISFQWTMTRSASSREVTGITPILIPNTNSPSIRLRSLRLKSPWHQIPQGCFFGTIPSSRVNNIHPYLSIGSITKQTKPVGIIFSLHEKIIWVFFQLPSSWRSPPLSKFYRERFLQGNFVGLLAKHHDKLNAIRY